MARVQRHLAPPVLHLWEKAEEQEGRGGRNVSVPLGQLSLGTTGSTISTLTDAELQPVCSDADNTSEATSPKQHSAFMSR